MGLMLQRHVSVTAAGYQVPDVDADQGTSALIRVEAGALRFLTNGDAPTANWGMLAPANTILELGAAALRNFRAIQTGITVATISISIFDGMDVRIYYAA